MMNWTFIIMLAIIYFKAFTYTIDRFFTIKKIKGPYGRSLAISFSPFKHGE